MNNTFNGALLRDKKTKKYFIQGTVYDIYHILRGKILTDNIQKIYVYKSDKTANRAKKNLIDSWHHEINWMDGILTRYTQNSTWWYDITRDEMIDLITDMKNDGEPDIEVIPFSFTI